MRILMCHNYYRLPGGEDQVFHDEARLLQEHGHEVIRYEKFNSDIESMSSFEVAKATIWNKAVENELDQLVAESQPDVVHFHNTFPLISMGITTRQIRQAYRLRIMRAASPINGYSTTNRRLEAF